MDSGGRQWSYCIQPVFQCAVTITEAFSSLSHAYYSIPVCWRLDPPCVYCFIECEFQFAVKVGFT